MRSPFARMAIALELNAMTLGIVAAFTASIAYATEIFIVSRLVNVHASGLVIASYEVVLGIALVSTIRFPMLVRFARNREPAVGGFRWALLAGASMAVALGAFFTALGHAPLSVIAPVGGVAPLAAYGMVLVLLRGRERITRRALLGVTLVAIGVALIGVYNT